MLQASNRQASLPDYILNRTAVMKGKQPAAFF
jgi:hypothetical protein